MFTGIISGVGRISQVKPAGNSADDGVHLTIEANNFDLAGVGLGDSIAVQGACMTVVSLDEGAFQIDVSRESLDKTTGLDQAGEVNLERSLKLGDSLDGHLVSGHVDGMGQVTRFEQVGESHELCIQVPAELAKYLAYKGSVTVNGVSLTVNSVTDNADGCEISINIIPHTLQVTTLKHLKEGTKVNLEIDMIARYVERMLK